MRKTICFAHTLYGINGDLKHNLLNLKIFEKIIVLFIEDYIDYGNNSFQELKYICDLQKEYG